MKLRHLGKSLNMISQLGITMITPILICTFIGVFLDNWSHKTPIFTVIFILLGAAAAFRNLLYHTMKQVKKDIKDKEEDHND